MRSEPPATTAYKLPPVLLAILVLAAIPRGAIADELSDHAGSDTAQLLRAIGKRVLDRGRRSLTIGPFAGAAPSVGITSTEFDLQVSVGVALLRYDIPLLPSKERIKSILMSRARSLFAKRLKAAITGGTPLSNEARRRIARQTWDEVKAEFVGKLEPRRFERPSFALRIELTRLTSAGAWNLHGLLGLGIGPVFASAGVAVAYDGGAALIVPVEVSVPMLTSASLRSPVVDLFLRLDIAATGRGGTAPREHRALLGARFVLDLL